MSFLLWLAIGYLLVAFTFYSGWWLVACATILLAVGIALKYGRISFLLFVLGIGLAFVRISNYESADLLGDLQDSSRVELLGSVCREVDVRRDRVQYTLCLDEYRNSKLLVVAELYPRYRFGDLLKVSGQLTTPEQIERFDYRGYLWRFGISKVMRRPKIELIRAGNGLGTYLFTVKDWLLRRINKIYHEPYASFLAGLLLGYRGGLPDELLMNFQRTGVTHIIAISGSNVALVVLLFERFLLFVPKQIRLVLIYGGLSLFCIFVGLSAAVVRAAIMGGLLLLGRYYGRDADVFPALLFSIFVMAVISPAILVFDAGLQLSVLAVVGIVVFSPMLNHLFDFFDQGSIVKEALVMTLAAQIGTLPLSIWLFAMLPLSAVVVNILIAPLLPLVMLLGAVSLVCSLVGGILVMVLAVPVMAILELILIIVNWFAKFDLLVWQIDTEFIPFAFILALIVVLLLAGFSYVFRVWSGRCSQVVPESG